MRANLHLPMIVFILFQWMSAVNGVPYQTYVSPENINCILCPPGQKVVEDCKSEASESKCEPCEAGFFMPHPNQNKYCNKCHQSACPNDAFVEMNCTATTNHVCKCQDGYHRYPLDELDDWLNCRRHTKCVEGEGVIHPGSHDKDRECRQCRTEIGQDQEFVNKTDPLNPVCQNCSTCSEGWIEKEPCSVVMDTTCSSNETEQTRTTNTAITESTEKSKTKLENKGLSGGAIAGIVLSVVCFLLLIPVVRVVIVCVRRKKKRHAIEKREMQVLMNEESRNATVSPQAYTPSTSQNGSIEIEWSQELITKDAFNFLSQNLGLKWETFIRSLPGFAGDEATKVIEMSTMDERYAVNQIHRALTEWFRRYPDVVTKESICKVLLDIELNETLDDMKKYLWKKNMHNNVQQSGALMEPVQESRHNHQ